MAKSIRVNIVGDVSGYQRALGQAESSTKKFGTGLTGVGKTALLAAGAAGIGGLTLALKAGIGEFESSQRVAAQTNAVLKSTGGVANVTAGQVDSLATAMLNKTGIDDEATKSAENVLLRFTAVRNETGKGNDVFNQATTAVADYAAAMAGGAVPSSEQMSAAALKVGKALNDPINNLGALRRAGVSFTEEQKEQIRTLQESGDTLGAQKIVLDELASVMGGRAAAAGQTFSGQVAIMRENAVNLAGELAGAVIPALSSMVGAISGVVSFMREHETATKVAIIALTGLAAAVAAVNVVMKAAAAFQAAYNAIVAVSSAVVGRFTVAADAAAVAQGRLNLAMRLNPVGLVITAVAALAAGILILTGRLGVNVSQFNSASGAARGYKTALDALKASADDVSEAHLRTRQAEINLDRARANLTTVTRTAKAGSVEYRQAVLDLERAQLDLKNETDAEKRAKDANRAATTQLADATDKLRGALEKEDKLLSTVNHKIGETGAHKVQKQALENISEAAGGVTTSLGAAIAKADSFRAAINNIPTYHQTTIETRYVTTGSPPPGRQHGGPVAASRPYIVGEAGPELFVPAVSGRIVNKIPVGSARPSGTVTINVNVGTVLGDEQAFVRNVAPALRSELKRIGLRNIDTGLR